MTWVSRAPLEYDLTFHDLVEGTVRGHVLDDLDLERILAVLLIEDCVHVVSLVGIANGATNAVAVLEELFGDMTSDIPVHACDEDKGSFGDCLHGIHHSFLYPTGAEHLESGVGGRIKGDESNATRLQCGV